MSILQSPNAMQARVPRSDGSGSEYCLSFGLLLTLLLTLAPIDSVRAAGGPGSGEIWFHVGGMGTPHWHDAYGDHQVNNRQAWWDPLFFQPDAPWPEAMNHVTAIEVSTQVMNQISKEDLAKVAQVLNQHHIGLAIQLLATDNTPREGAPEHCGAGVEGYDSPEETGRIAAKLKQAGINLKYINMDEPLWFGHYYNEKNACRSTIDNVAERVAANLAAYQKLWPDVAIGDIEPVPSLTVQPNWQNDYHQWLQAFQAHTGRPLAYFVLDIDWYNGKWEQNVQSMTSYLRSQRVKFATIYNSGVTPTMTNDEYLDAAHQHFVHIERDLHIVPDFALFDSWVRFPLRAISDPTERGQDFLVNEYVKLGHRK